TQSAPETTTSDDSHSTAGARTCEKPNPGLELSNRLQPGAGPRRRPRSREGIAAEICADDKQDDRLAACVRAAIEKLEFPPPRDGGVVRVAYPFNFGR